MIKRKHTPGPWKSVWFPFPEECPDIFAHIEDAKGKWVAQLWSRVDKDLIESPEETKANARLIAVTTEMLEALEWLANEFDCRGDEYGVLFTHSDFAKVRDVLRKVRAEHD
jgi:hypothetical protein